MGLGRTDPRHRDGGRLRSSSRNGLRAMVVLFVSLGLWLFGGAATAEAWGGFLLQFGGTGSGTGQFTSPYGVAVDPRTGDVYVSDTPNDRVEKFTSSGHYLLKFGSHGSGNGQLTHPFGVAVDPR